MAASAVPFRLDDEAREARLREFTQRAEILWFGFHGAFETPGLAEAGAFALASAMVAPAGA